MQLTATSPSVHVWWQTNSYSVIAASSRGPPSEPHTDCPAGVLNTDNMSIVGATLDYGPYGFMDRQVQCSLFACLDSTLILYSRLDRTSREPIAQH